MQTFQCRELASGIGLDKDLTNDFIKICKGLYEAFMKCDASLAEINPLVVTDEGTLLAVDGKMVLDDNALFRHGDLAELRDANEENIYESEARRYGLSYVRLDGCVGCMVNGAGLAMETMDIIKLFGAEPANFLDIGGGARADKVAAALRIILSDENVCSILINIFGGITRGDEVARGIIQALEEIRPDVPIITRLIGTNSAEGLEILKNANSLTASSLVEAAQLAAKAGQGNLPALILSSP